MLSNKQCKEDDLIQRAVITTIQTLYDKVIFDQYNNGIAHENSEDFLFVERRRGDLEKVNDVVRRFCS